MAKKIIKKAAKPARKSGVASKAKKKVGSVKVPSTKKSKATKKSAATKPVKAYKSTIKKKNAAAVKAKKTVVKNTSKAKLEKNKAAAADKKTVAKKTEKSVKKTVAKPNIKGTSAKTKKAAKPTTNTKTIKKATSKKTVAAKPVKTKTEKAKKAIKPVAKKTTKTSLVKKSKADADPKVSSSKTKKVATTKNKKVVTKKNTTTSSVSTLKKSAIPNTATTNKNTKKETAPPASKNQVEVVEKVEKIKQSLPVSKKEENVGKAETNNKLSATQSAEQAASKPKPDRPTKTTKPSRKKKEEEEDGPSTKDLEILDLPDFMMRPSKKDKKEPQRQIIRTMPVEKEVIHQHKNEKVELNPTVVRTNNKIKIELEYMIKSSPRILYNFLSTPSGLSEWFADDVNIQNGIYSFFWEDSEEKARLLVAREFDLVRFKWLSTENDDTYFEMRIKIDELTGDVALIITDFAPKDELQEVQMLWDAQIHDLQKALGS